MKLKDNTYIFICEIINTLIKDIKDEFIQWYRESTLLDACDDDDIMDYLLEMLEENNETIEEAIIWVVKKIEYYKIHIKK